MSSPKVHQGSCLCRSIKYNVTGEPYFSAVCHCINCRKSSGSAFLSNAFYKPEQVVTTLGSEIIKNYRDTETQTGRALIRWFCAKCGSSVFMSGDDNTFKIVNVGSFDEGYTWLPKKEMFPECKREWVVGIKTAPKPTAKL